MSKQHALLAPSSSHRWLVCTPSARLEQTFDDQSSDAAAEGTAAHALAEHKLRRALKMRSKRPVSQYDSDEMEMHTDSYVEYVLEILEQARLTCKDPLVRIEQHLDLSKYVPEGKGTGDCIIVSDSTLHIIDLKYGQGVLVEADGNPQMKLYALGALELFDFLYDVDNVVMTIYQPRRENVSTEECSKGSLYKWANDILKPTAKKAFWGEGDYIPGEHCQFCRAAVKCRARAAEKLRLAKLDFAQPPVLTDEEIGDCVLPKLDDLTSWANSIKEYALQSAIAGKEWPGFKLVAGRSNRKYANEDAVGKAAKAAGYTDIYRTRLITLTEMERLLGKKEFNEVLGDLVIKPPGKPTLVQMSDKRPAINKSAKQEFMEDN